MENTSDNIKAQELILEYPLLWEYKIVAFANADINGIIAKLLDGKTYKLKESKKSKSGTYKSYSLALEVESKNERKTIFESLRSHSNIKFVL